MASFVGREGDHIKMNVDDTVVLGREVCIAVGSKPVEAPFEGKDNCIDSNGFFALEELPSSMVFIGGGYIGVELAGMAQQLGSKTTLITRP